MQVGERELFIGDHVAVPVERIVVDHPDDSAARVESFDSSRFPWITLWVHRFAEGVLDCEVVDFKPRDLRRSRRDVDVSAIRELSIFYDCPKVLELARVKIRRAIPEPPPKPRPVSRPEPPREFWEEVGFSAPLNRFRFGEGYAEIDWNGTLRASCESVGFCVRIKNSLFTPKLNCIQSYLANAINGLIDVTATVHIRDGAASVEKASAPKLDAISSELIGKVRYRFVKGELRKWGGGKGRIVTASRFFGKTAAGFGESDAKFVADIVRAKDFRHSAHIEYLAGLHDATQVRLRLVREPFSFLFFIPGESGSYFVWETFDGTDATYIWRFKTLAYYRDGHRDELGRAVRQVERDLDYIHAAGRNEYMEERKENFIRIFHDYREMDGLERWKREIDRLLADGTESAC
ncbi:hypothetical protein [Pontiella sp.]|uniref:hypothetical protein n=1 Tax=Pontiella sp. TaxID=2837462 RepID=UPI003564507E